jgi:hypothetical protein
MLQARCELNLATETLGFYRCPDVLVQDLYYDFAPEGKLSRKEESRHAATIELALDGIAAGECALELLP